LAVAAAGGLQSGSFNSSIYMAAALDTAVLRLRAPQLLHREKLVFWAPSAKAVVGRTQLRIGGLVVEVRHSPVWMLMFYMIFIRLPCSIAACQFQHSLLSANRT
jgi:hypothetical protein